jgi:hypothetical protein
MKYDRSVNARRKAGPGAGGAAERGVVTGYRGDA